MKFKPEKKIQPKKQPVDKHAKRRMEILQSQKNKRENMIYDFNVLQMQQAKKMECIKQLIDVKIYVFNQNDWKQFVSGQLYNDFILFVDKATNGNSVYIGPRKCKNYTYSIECVNKNNRMENLLNLLILLVRTDFRGLGVVIDKVMEMSSFLALLQAHNNVIIHIILERLKNKRIVM